MIFRSIPAAALVAALGAAACSSPSNRPVDAERRPLAPVAPEAPAPAAEKGPEVTVAKPVEPVEPPAAAAPVIDDTTVAWPRTVDGSVQTMVASVGGQGIPLTDLVSKWVLRDPDGVRAILDDLLLSRIVTFEAAALDVRLPDGAIADEVARRMAGLERTAREVGAPDLEVYVKRRLGLEVAALRAELEREAAIDLLAPRCVRAWLLSSDRREIRAIAVDDRATADQVQARLAKGDDFEALAREYSKDPSDDGGRMPPVVRSDQPVARTAFATQVGSVSAPIQDSRGFVFLKVVGAPDPLEGDWAAIGARVEADLAEQSIEDPEFWQWKDAMYLRYDIDITPSSSWRRGEGRARRPGLERGRRVRDLAV